MIVLILDQVDFRTKPIVREKEGHFRMIKGSIQHKDTTIINVLAHNSFKMHEAESDRAKWRSGHIHNIRVGDFNVSFSVIGITICPLPVVLPASGRDRDQMGEERKVLCLMFFPLP